MIRTYKYKILPTKRQRVVLENILERQRQLWNAALQERIDCYKKTGKSISFFDQCNSLTICRHENPEMKELPNNLQRGTLKRLATSFSLFYTMVKRGGKASPPRFRGRDRFSCISFDVFQGIRLVNNKLKFKGLSSGLRVHWHRQLPNRDIKSCQIFRRHNGWFVCFQVAVDPVPLPDTGKTCGLDMGVENLAALDSGIKVPTLEHLNILERQRKRSQRKVSRAKRGSNNRRKKKLSLSKISEKIKNARKTYLRQVTADLFRQYDTVIIEDLSVKNMLSKKRNHKSLNRSLNNSALGLFTTILAEKAESAARQLIKIDPRGTSQECPSCGLVKKKPLSQRVHHCSKCGCKMHRDVAAAKVILQRGLALEGSGVVVAGVDIKGVSSETQKPQFQAETLPSYNWFNVNNKVKKHCYIFSRIGVNSEYY